MRAPTCNRELEVTRALHGEPDASLAAHLAGCGTCQQTWRGFESALAFARELATPMPPPARRDEVRAAVLAAAESGQTARIRPLFLPPFLPRAARGRWLALGAAVALVALGIARGHRRDTRPPSHAAVHAHAGAAFTMTSPPPDETWRLREGTVDLEIEPLGPEQRFRVMAGDGEVEVRGTAFTVAATGDRLAGVSVARGRVEIRPRAGDAAPLMLGPGQAWRQARYDDASPVGAASPAPPPAPAALKPEATPSPPPPPIPARRPERPRERSVALSGREHARPPAPTTQESLYDDAWDAMRAGDFAKAAVRFAGVVATSAPGPLADEGAFWRAVATARAGHAPLAAELFRDMLGAYPASPRRGEAAAMLGWLLLEAGHPDQARPLFRAAAHDPSERVRASARHGLEAVPSR